MSFCRSFCRQKSPLCALNCVPPTSNSASPAGAARFLRLALEPTRAERSALFSPLPGFSPRFPPGSGRLPRFWTPLRFCRGAAFAAASPRRSVFDRVRCAACTRLRWPSAPCLAVLIRPVRSAERTEGL